MEIIEIEPETIDLDNLDIKTQDTVNFGGGIELLMNNNQKDKQPTRSSDINIDDISRLEEDLNNLVPDNNIKNEPTINIENSREKIPINLDNKSINLDNKTEKKPSFLNNIFGKQDGKNISKLSGINEDNMNSNKTNDGYGKFNNVPLSNSQNNQETMSPEETLKKKFEYLKLLEGLEKKGVNLSQKYNMESNLNEMIGEYETLISDRERQNSVKFQGKMLMACITGLEFLNNKFDPFDIKLEGWAEQLNENIDDYDELFGELHEKYKSKAKMTPELKLLFQLGGSAMMVHMSNTLFKSSMPGMDDIMRQNPELMRQFSQAAVNTMGQTNPGFGNFMNNVYKENGPAAAMGFGNNKTNDRPMPPNINIGPPPSQYNSRLPERSMRENNIKPSMMNNNQGGVDLNNNGLINEEPRILRPEMSGPSKPSQDNNIKNLLSGLKTREIDVNDKKNEASTISIEDLNNLTNVKTGKAKRKQKSDKSTISLDI